MEFGNFLNHHTPQHFIVDGIVSMNQSVSQTNDFMQIWNKLFDFLLATKVAESLTTNFELSLDCRLKNF